MNKSILSALLCACVVLGCKDNTGHSTDKEVILIDLTEPGNDTPDKFDSIFDYKHYIALENHDSALIGMIGKIKFYKDNLYILDSKTDKILAFDASGRYLRQYAHLGNGPHEYTNLKDFDIVDDTLYLLNRFTKNLLKYDLENDTCFGSEKIEKAIGIHVFPDGDYALNIGFGSADGDKQQRAQSYAFYKQNELLLRDVPFNRHLRGHSYIQGEGSNTFYTAKERVFTVFPFNDTLYTVSPKDGRLIRLASIQINKRHINTDTSEGEVKKLKSELARSIYAYYNWDDYHFFSYSRIGDRRTSYVLASPEGDLLFHGHLGLDKNRFPISIVPYDTQENDKPLLNLLYPHVIMSVAKTYGNESPLLKELASKVTAEGNPVLMFYEFKRPVEKEK